MKFLFILLMSMMTCFVSHAETLQQIKDVEFGLNQASPGAMAKFQLGTKIVKSDVLVARAKYDFAVQGGAVGTGNLVGEDGKIVTLPNGAVIVDCLIDVITPATTSASGTIALTANSAADLKAATAAASYTGRVACIPVGSAATAIKLTADRTLTYSIATGAITAGKFWIYVQYIVGGT